MIMLKIATGRFLGASYKIFNNISYKSNSKIILYSYITRLNFSIFLLMELNFLMNLYIVTLTNTFQ